MIKTALIHHIVDLCISNFFDNISKNIFYSIHKTKTKLPKVGEFFSKIVHRKYDKTVTYYNCTIMYSIDNMCRFSLDYYCIDIDNISSYYRSDEGSFLKFRYIGIKDLRYLQFYQ